MANDFVAEMWGEFAPLPGEIQGDATINTVGVLTPSEREMVEAMSQFSGMSLSRVVRVAVRRLARDAKKAQFLKAEKA